MQSPDPAPLFEAMSSEVAGHRAAILSEARAEARAIVEAGRRDADAWRDRALADARRALELQERQERERIHQDTARRAQQAVQLVEEEVLARVRAELDRVAPAPGFGSVVLRLLEELLEAPDPIDPQGPVRVLAPPAHVEACREWLLAHGYNAVEVAAAPGLRDGVALEDPQRTCRVTHSLTRRFEKVEGEVRRRVHLALAAEVAAARETAHADGR